MLMQNGIFAFRNVYIIRYLKLGRIEIGKNIGASFLYSSCCSNEPSLLTKILFVYTGRLNERKNLSEVGFTNRMKKRSPKRRYTFYLICLIYVL